MTTKAEATATIPAKMTGGDYFECSEFGISITAKTCTKRQEARTGDGKPVHRPCGRRDGPNGQTPCAQGRAVLVALQAARKHESHTNVDNTGPVDRNAHALDDVPAPVAHPMREFVAAGMSWRVTLRTATGFRVDCRVRGAWATVGTITRHEGALRGAESFNRSLFPGCASLAFLEALVTKVRELDGDASPLAAPLSTPRPPAPVAPMLASAAPKPPENKAKAEEDVVELAEPAEDSIERTPSASVDEKEETPAPALAARVREWLRANADAKTVDLYAAFPDAKRPSLRAILNEFVPEPPDTVGDVPASRTAAARASIVLRRAQRGAARDAWVDGGRVGPPPCGICEVRGCAALLRSDSKGTICADCRHRGERAQAFDTARARPSTDEVAAAVEATREKRATVRVYDTPEELARDGFVGGVGVSIVPAVDGERTWVRVSQLVMQLRKLEEEQVTAARLIADVKRELAVALGVGGAS